MSGKIASIGFVIACLILTLALSGCIIICG